jgi:molybdopterin molybdotransferase
MTDLPDYRAALDLALAAARPLDDTETVPLAEADGRVLAVAIVADRDLPPFDRAQMDGYALRAGEVGVVEAWPVSAVVPAGAAPPDAVPPGTCVRIATGAMLPADVDTVIQHERSDRGDPVRFTIDAVDAGHAVHPRGADAKAGATLVAAGTRLGPHHLGLAAAVGAATPVVRTRPRAIVLTSGDEVRGVEDDVAVHQIRNSNGPQTLALLRRCGAEGVAHRHVMDEPEPTASAVGAALAEADLVVTIGGISAGERDHFPGAFDAHGVERNLHGAAIQPGKPVIAGRAPGGAVVVGLPGNPVSSLACACLFAWPIVRRLLGLDPALPWRTVENGAPVRPNPKRRAFRPARLDGDGRACVPAWAGSGDLAHTAETDGLLELPVQREEVAPGTPLPFLPWP